MNFTKKCVRTLSLGGTLSLILLTMAFQITGTRDAEAQTTLTEMSRPTYNVGYQYLSVNEKGEEITTTLTRLVAKVAS